MGKIKINFLSGTSIEKPLITAFKGTNGDYIALDNEISGSMGLPIILISRIEGSNLVKIENKSAEWDAVKESLRQIIAGAHTDYVNVPLEVTAPDDFFTQLTLPINSFDLLKSKYVVTTPGVAPVAPAPTVEPTPVAPVTPEPIIQPTPVAPVTPEPAVQPTPVTPVTPEPVIQPTPVAPVTPEPAVQPTPVAPVTPEPAVQPTPVAPVTPEPAAQPTPVTPVTPEPAVKPSNNAVDFTADKEAFLKACENMFDALVSKINK